MSRYSTTSSWSHTRPCPGTISVPASRDTIGTDEAHEDSDSVGTGSRGAAVGPDAREGGDILPDRVVNLADGEGFPEADPDGIEMTDLDNDDAQASADRDEENANR